MLEIRQLLSGKARTKLRGFLVPLTRFRRVGGDADSAAARNHAGVECLRQRKRAVRTTRGSCAVQQKPGSDKITVFQAVLTAFEQCRDFSRIEMQDDRLRLWFGPRLRRSGRGRLSAMELCLPELRRFEAGLDSGPSAARVLCRGHGQRARLVPDQRAA